MGMNECLILGMWLSLFSDITTNKGNFSIFIRKLCNYWFSRVFLTSEISSKAENFVISYHMHLLCLDIFSGLLNKRKRKSILLDDIKVKK